MTGPRVLVIDGNRAETRARQLAAGGRPTGEGYAETLQRLLPGIQCDIVRPADEEPRLARPLDGYDGVAMTGSALNIYDGGPHIQRQVELARAVFAAGVPFFGSCWGLQVAVTVAGGCVAANPLGREFGIARRIALTAAGRAHAMYTGKADVFEAVAVHKDHIERLPAGATVLATNELGLQAAEIRFDRGVFWGVQYHPEYGFGEIAAVAVRYGATLIEEGLFEDAADLDRWVGEFRGLEGPDRPRHLAWRHGLGPALLDPAQKLAELANWLRLAVLPASRCRT
jgi:GMP synthase (glutamine-hydrolysing)